MNKIMPACRQIISRLNVLICRWEKFELAVCAGLRWLLDHSPILVEAIAAWYYVPIVVTRAESVLISIGGSERLPYQEVPMKNQDIIC